MIAYGGEHGFVHPPRPTDPKVPWEQEWSVRLRVKSQTMAMLGQDLDGADEGQGRRSRNSARPQAPSTQQMPEEAPADKSGTLPGLPNPFNAIKVFLAAELAQLHVSPATDLGEKDLAGGVAVGIKRNLLLQALVGA